MASLMSKSIKVSLYKNGEELVRRSMTSFMALGGLVVPAGIIIQKIFSSNLSSHFLILLLC